MQKCWEVESTKYLFGDLYPDEKFYESFLI